MTLTYQAYYTLEDYQHWEGDWELFDGMPYAMDPSPSVTHQTVSLNIASILKEAFKSQQAICDHCCVLMETDWHVSNDTIVRPDVMVVCQDIPERVMVTPELIIEVVSASSSKRDELMKFDLYQREGVLYYLLVYPDKRLIKIYKNHKAGFKKQAEWGEVDTVNFDIGACKFGVDLALISCEGINYYEWKIKSTLAFHFVTLVVHQCSNDGYSK